MKAGRIKCLKTTVASPNLNLFAERFVTRVSTILDQKQGQVKMTGQLFTNFLDFKGLQC